MPGANSQLGEALGDKSSGRLCCETLEKGCSAVYLAPNHTPSPEQPRGSACRQAPRRLPPAAQ